MKSLNNKSGYVFWITGLSGSGKSNIGKKILPYIKKKLVRNIYKDDSIEYFKYYKFSKSFDAGVNTYIELFDKSVFISGFCIKKEYSIALYVYSIVLVHLFLYFIHPLHIWGCLSIICVCQCKCYI